MNCKTYIFVRQDISNEQQAVQAAHVAMVLGEQNEQAKDTPLSSKHEYSYPESTTFILIGVRNLEALLSVEEICVNFEIEYVTFFEPDIGEVTAIATHPLKFDYCGPLLAFDTLRFR